MKIILSLNIILIFAGVSFNYQYLSAQNMNPVAYFNFDQAKWQQDAFGNNSLNGKSCIKWHNEGGIAGGYLEFMANNCGALNIPFKSNRAISIECWLRFSDIRVNEENLLFHMSDGSLKLAFNYPTILFQTKTILPNGKPYTDMMKIDLYGDGMESFNYYVDGDWHHFVIKFDAVTGRKELWIDGRLPKSFTKKVEKQGIFCKGQNCNKRLSFNFNEKYEFNFIGDLDELAIYDAFIPNALHIGHFHSGKKGERYSFRIPSKRTSGPVLISSKQIDFREFGPNHPTVKISALEQIKKFPLPRYSSENTLLRNYNWFYMLFFGGAHIKEVGRKKGFANAVALQEEMINHWNYSIQLSNPFRVTRNDELLEAEIDLANRYPDIPVTITTLWGQVKHKNEKGTVESAYIMRNKLPNEYYLPESSARYLAKNPRFKGKRSISPNAPLQLMTKDGEGQADYIRDILNKLNRTPFMINENGEMPFYPFNEAVLDVSKELTSDKEALKIDNWATYQSVKKTSQRTAYRDGFMKTIPELKDTYFTWYAVSEAPYIWKEIRKVMTPINGQYYSTISFYPKWPYNWKKGTGPWKGWDYLEHSRQQEIMAGDKLCSPFIAAGWDRNPEKNIRPSQWLGLLKCLGVVGAEFFYTGFFHQGDQEQRNSLPQNFVWQAVVPSYAQAITSRFEDILRNGSLLKDEQGLPMIRHKTGDPTVLLCVRKDANRARYVIAGSIQAVSNVRGNIPDSTITNLTLEGKNMTLKLRRQGSVYVLDMENPKEPVFYQLDKWHEAGHPWWWSEDIYLEAALFDKGSNVQICTETPRDAHPYDFSQFKSYIKSESGGTAKVSYNFEFREPAKNSYHIRVKARNTNSKNGTFTLSLDDISIGKFYNVRENDWNWYVVNVKKGRRNDLDFDKTKHKLSLELINSGVQIERIEVERN